MNTTNNGQATATAIKTQYNDRMERVYDRLNTGRRKTAAVRYREATPYDSHPVIMLNVYGHRERFTVRSIGCNSFGIEVCLKDKYNCTSWTAIEQLSQSQQQKVISAIDWTTLN